MSEGKFSKCEEGEKCLSIEFRVFGKKKNGREKKDFWEKMFGWNFLLSSCSLVRFCINLQVKVTEKKNGNFQSNLRLNI